MAPSPNRYHELLLGKNTCGDPFNVEEQTDVEASYDMAPGANQLVVGGDSCNNGDFGNQALFDADILRSSTAPPPATTTRWPPSAPTPGGPTTTARRRS